RITAASGLTEQEIERMVQDAERFAGEDKGRKEKAETLNQAESLLYTTEKTLGDVKDSVPKEQQEQVQKAMTKLREALGNEDLTAIKTAMEGLTKSSHVLAEALYKKNGAQPGGEEGAAGGASQGGGSAKGGAGDADNVVDAEFEEVKDNK
ncbi:MAG: Hsp70 family protein, partial [Deltaproteobacteria bacterium]|nr:Hsp70 family protein [Deltaproteobacteria bacterium]